MWFQAHLRPSERASCQVVWSQADNWIPFFTTHMEAIRAKYFPTTVVKPMEGKVEVEAVASPADEKLQQEPLAVQALPPHALLPRFSNTVLPPNALPPRLSNRLSVKFSGRVHPLQASPFHSPSHNCMQAFDLLVVRSGCSSSDDAHASCWVV